MGQPMHVDGAPFPLSPSGHASATSQEDEWEYEYDENEQETLYFTLDLTTHVPNALVVANKDTQKVKQPGFVWASARGGLPQSSKTSAAERSISQQGSGDHELQIVDLHSDKPLVRFDDDFYDCYWSTDLGTQFHLSQAGATATPRRPGRVLDVVGTSQTRLIGKPVELAPRQGRRLATRRNTGLNATPVGEGSDANGRSSRKSQPISAETTYGEPLKIDREGLKDAAAVAQASFLERLSEIKLKKGELDQVPVIAVKKYDLPMNVAELRHKALEKDAERQKRHIEADGQKRQRAKRHRPTNAEKEIFVSDIPSLAGRQSREAMTTRIGFQEGVGVPNMNSLAANSPAHGLNPSASTSATGVVAPAISPSAQAVMHRETANDDASALPSMRANNHTTTPSREPLQESDIGREPGLQEDAQTIVGPMSAGHQTGQLTDAVQARLAGDATADESTNVVDVSMVEATESIIPQTGRQQAVPSNLFSATVPTPTSQPETPAEAQDRGMDLSNRNDTNAE